MLSKKMLIILLFIILLSNIYFFGYTKSCDTEECFLKAINSCAPVKYDNIVNNNIYVYTIQRSFSNDCKLNVKLERASEGTDFDTRYKLEGKSMTCFIPIKDFLIIDFKEVNNFLKYCSGQLKEGIYEIIIKNMYSIIISNIGEILGEVQTSLIKKLY